MEDISTVFLAGQDECFIIFHNLHKDIYFSAQVPSFPKTAKEKKKQKKILSV